MLLHNILITSAQGEGASALPPIVAQNVGSLKRRHPKIEHRLWGEAEARELIETNFPAEIRRAYASLKPYAYKADLARYCILHHFGGLYADLSYYFVGTIPMDEKIVVFRGNMISAPWDTSNGIIYAPPGHKAIEQAIELVCDNVKRHYYGPNGLCPTGPALFGKALAMTCDPEEVVCGVAVLIPKEQVEKRFPDLHFPPGERVHGQFLKRKLIAIKRKRLLAEGIGELGVTDGNSYREMWNAGDIYA